MKLFQNKYRTRIEERIIELVKTHGQLISDRDNEKQTMNPARYSHYSVAIGDIKNHIDLLKSLL